MSQIKSALNLLLASLCFCLALGIALEAGLPQPLAPKSAAVGSIAPAFMLRNLAGERVSLSPMPGRATIINFWSTNCPPCRHELPALQQLHERYAGAVRVLAVNLGDNPADAANWRDQLGLSFELLLDPAQVLRRSYRIRGLPTTFLLDERLVIRELVFGAQSYEQMRAAFLRLARQS